MPIYAGRDPVPSPQVQAEFPLLYDPSTFDVLSAGLSEGWNNTLPAAMGNISRMVTSGQAADALAGYGIASRETIQEGLEYFFGAPRGEPVEEAAWKASPDFRPGLTYFEGMTDAQARDLAAYHDKRQWNRMVLSKADSVGDWTAFVAGTLLGNLPDPVNFIPIAGWSAKGLGVARSGLAVRSALGALEAGVAAAAVSPALVAQARLYQDDYDYRMVVQDVSVSMALGAGFGAIGHTLSRMGETRRMEASRLAAAQMSEGRPVDVTPVLRGDGQNIDDAARVALFDAETAVGLDKRLGDILVPIVEDGAPTPRVEDARAVLDILSTPPHQRTAEDLVTLRHYDITPEIEDALRIQQTPGHLRSAEDMVTLKAFFEGKEAELIETRVAPLKERIRELDAEIAQRRTQARSMFPGLGDEQPGIAKALTERRSLEARILEAESRIEDLQGRKPIRYEVARETEPDVPEQTLTRQESPDALPPPDAADVEDVRTQTQSAVDEGRLLPEEAAELEAARAQTGRAKRYRAALIDSVYCVTKG